MKALVLASQSPRRAELLGQLGVEFVCQVADIDETPHGGEPVEAFVRRMAREKALAVSSQRADEAWVLGSDTVVAIDQHILGKPRDEEQFIEMMALLSGRTHQVLTAVALCQGERLLEDTVISQVRFRAIDEQEARAYWRTGEPCDKAGGYAIQGRGAIFAEHIAGSYSAIMGLPVFETARLLEVAGYRMLS